LATPSGEKQDPSRPRDEELTPGTGHFSSITPLFGWSKS